MLTEVLQKWDLRSDQKRNLLYFLDKDTINLREVDRPKNINLGA